MIRDKTNFMMQTLPIETFLTNLQSYDLIIDARSPREYGESHVKNFKKESALVTTDENVTLREMQKSIAQTGYTATH